MYNLNVVVSMVSSNDIDQGLIADYVYSFIRYSKFLEQEHDLIQSAFDDELKAIIMQKVEMRKYIELLKFRLKTRGIEISDDEIELDI